MEHQNKKIKIRYYHKKKNEMLEVEIQVKLAKWLFRKQQIGFNIKVEILYKKLRIYRQESLKL